MADSPDPADMVGIAPNWTGGACVDCYVRHQRHDDDGVVHDECCRALGLGAPSATCCCGHQQNAHDAGECWANVDGRQCGCSWYELAPPATTAEEWNARYPVGTRVRYWPGPREGTGVPSVTRTPAWTLGSGDPVVSVGGYPGGVVFTHVAPDAPPVTWDHVDTTIRQALTAIGSAGSDLEDCVPHSEYTVIIGNQLYDARNKLWSLVDPSKVHEPADQPDAPPDRPPVVCICGSSRFADTMNEVGQRLTLDGKIVVRLEVVTYSDAAGPQRTDPGLKARLDELHKRKIDLADEVYVVDVDGYAGESTKSEIAYAAAAGKPVSYHSEGSDAPAPWT